MGKPKKGSEDVTRDVLESYIWTSTGWRGSPDVIEAILKRVDDYTGVQVARECAVLAMAHRKELDAAADRAARETAAAVAAAERVQEAPTVERATLEQLLEQLAGAHIAAASTLTASTRTLNAIGALITAMRAADGKAKDIALSERIAERRADPAFRERLADSTARNSAALERLAADAEAFSTDGEDAPPVADLEIVTRGDAQTARALGARDEDFDAEFNRRVDAAVARGEFYRELQESAAARDSGAEVLPDIAEYVEPEPENVTVVPSETFDQLMEETEPVPNETTRRAFQRLEHPDAMMVTAEPEEVEPEPEPDPIMALVAEAEAEMLADGTGKRCSACKHVKLRADFYKDKAAPDGLMYSCRTCNASRARARDAAAAAKRAEAIRGD